MTLTGTSALRPAVFLDKDGTLIDDVPYNVDPARICLTPGARDGVRALQRAGYALVVASNQSGVARGLFTVADLAGVRARIEALLGLRFDAFRFCPHLPTGRVPAFSRVCECRKPRPGLLLRAARDLGLDLARSWMVGDILHDVEAGTRAGCRSALLLNGSETEWQLGPHRTPTLLAPDLGAAVEAILAADRDAFPRALSRPTPARALDSRANPRPAPDRALDSRANPRLDHPPSPRPGVADTPDAAERTAPDGSPPLARA